MFLYVEFSLKCPCYSYVQFIGFPSVEPHFNSLKHLKILTTIHSHIKGPMIQYYSSTIFFVFPCYLILWKIYFSFRMHFNITMLYFLFSFFKNVEIKIFLLAFLYVQFVTHMAYILLISSPFSHLPLLTSV